MNTATATQTERQAFLAKRAELITRMGLRTTSQYLADTAHLVNPDPKAGTDWEGR